MSRFAKEQQEAPVGNVFLQTLESWRSRCSRHSERLGLRLSLAHRADTIFCLLKRGCSSHISPGQSVPRNFFLSLWKIHGLYMGALCSFHIGISSGLVESFEGHLFLNIQGEKTLKMTEKGHPFSIHRSYIMTPGKHNKNQNKGTSTSILSWKFKYREMIYGSFIFHVGLTPNRAVVLKDSLDGGCSHWQWGSVWPGLSHHGRRTSRGDCAVVEPVDWQPASLCSGYSSVTSLCTCGTLGR